MKCSGCKFYVKSKVIGNHCTCRGDKPCERIKRLNDRNTVDKKRKKRYGTQR